MEEEDIKSEFGGGCKKKTKTVDEVTLEPFASWHSPLNHHAPLATLQTPGSCRQAWDAPVRPGSLEASPRVSTPWSGGKQEGGGLADAAVCDPGRAWQRAARLRLALR